MFFIIYEPFPVVDMEARLRYLRRKPRAAKGMLPDGKKWPELTLLGGAGCMMKPCEFTLCLLA